MAAIDVLGLGPAPPNPLVGRRVRLKVDRQGIIWNDNGTGTGKKLNYTVHQAHVGDEGTVVEGIYHVQLDNGIEVGYSANDFIIPEEEFYESYDFI